MNKLLLITRPRNDSTTEYLSFFAGKIIGESKKRGLKIRDIKDKEVTKENFIKNITKLNPKIIFINGHGNPNCLFGDKEVIVQEGVNEDILKERIVYARACDAGLSLGKACVKDTNEGCFIGYKLPFTFWIDETWSTNPAKDNTAKLFLEPSNEIILSLVKGNEAKKADINSKRMMIKNIKNLLKKEEEPQNIRFVEALWNNFTGQVLYGNPNAKI